VLICWCADFLFLRKIDVTAHDLVIWWFGDLMIIVPE
jgi:hypothetical protein